jgi:hypothetical protein
VFLLLSVDFIVTGVNISDFAWILAEQQSGLAANAEASGEAGAPRAARR